MMKVSPRWLWLLILIPILVGLVRLRFDVEVLNLLPEDSPVVRGLKLYQENFANSRELIITIDSSHPEISEAAARHVASELRRHTNLVSQVTWQPPWLENPAEAAELVAYLWLNQSPENFQQLLERVAPHQLAATLANTKEQLATSFSPEEIALLSYDPFGLMRLPESVTAPSAFGSGDELFASPDGTFRMVFVEANSPLSDYQACVAWLEAIQSIVREGTHSSGQLETVEINFTGRPAFVAEIAGGMERDMLISVGGTLVIVGFLFWVAHRQFRPLFWTVFLLGLILAATTALGGLIFGTLNVVSLGFAAILLGLAVDYGMVLYQEAKISPRKSPSQVSRQMAPGIIWSALTTGGAFLLLNLSGLPGLGQLGSLVAIGTGLAALVMLAFYLPVLRRQRSKEASAQVSTADAIPPRSPRHLGPIVVSAAIIALALSVLSFRPPLFDPSPDTLRPRNSTAYAAVEKIKLNLNQTIEPLWILVQAQAAEDMSAELVVVESILERAVTNGLISNFTLAPSLWPQTRYQESNRPGLVDLVSRKEALYLAARQNGFTADSLALTERLFQFWEEALATPSFAWPTNRASRWVLDKIAAKSSDGWVAMGLVYPATNATGEVDSSRLREFQQRILAGSDAEKVWISGWTLLGNAMLEQVRQDLPRVLALTLVLLTVTLGFAFRRIAEVLLSFVTLAFSALLLFLIMALAGWSWNLLNLMALPLLLGTGVDYSIHVQLALRRHNGDIQRVRRSTGRALLLCGGSTIAAFASLAFSNNTGLASLGKVCAAGIAATLVTSLYLLPAWHTMRTRKTSNPAAGKTGASLFYRSRAWRFGLWIVQTIPAPLSRALCRLVARLYWHFNAARREVVIQNLLVPLKGNRRQARHMSQRLLQQFAIKLNDLWGYESGIAVDTLFEELTGWDHFLAAEKQKRGVLLLTPHLGNWEFGAPLLAQRGFKILVITLDEPDDRLTEMRQAARARWGIETLVIAKDPFAFLAIIRQLQAGAVVALLMDRPPENSAVNVTLFGRNFSASIAAAELARASGAVLLPAYLPRTQHGYAAHILPEISYDRPSLRDIESRRQLTQRIMTAFEQPIFQNLDQWYHFVPVWPDDRKTKS